MMDEFHHRYVEDMLQSLEPGVELIQQLPTIRTDREVYLVTLDGERYIMKFHYHECSEKHEAEVEALKLLVGVPRTPQLIAEYEHWKRVGFRKSYAPGIILQHYEGDKRELRDSALEVVRNVHGAGVCGLRLHKGDVLVDANSDVWLFDFNFASLNSGLHSGELRELVEDDYRKIRELLQ